MKLGTKLPLVMAVTIAIVACAGLFGIQRLNAVAGTYARVIDVDYAAMIQSAQIAESFKTQVQEWKNTLLRGKDPRQLEKYWRSFLKEEEEVATAARRLQASLPAGEAKQLVGQFVEAHGRMGTGYRAGYAAFVAADFKPSAGDEAVKGMDRAASELLNQVAAKLMAQTTAAVA